MSSKNQIMAKSYLIKKKKKKKKKWKRKFIKAMLVAYNMKNLERCWFNTWAMATNDFLCHGHMRKFTFLSHLRFFINFSSQNSYLLTHVNISLRSILSYVIMPKKKTYFITITFHTTNKEKHILVHKGGTKIRLERQQKSSTSW